MCSIAPYTPLMAVPQGMWVCMSEAKRFSNLPSTCYLFFNTHALTHTHTHERTYILFSSPGSFRFRQRCERESFVGFAYIRFPTILRSTLLPQSRVNATVPIIHLVFVFATSVLRQSLCGPRLISGSERQYHTRTNPNVYNLSKTPFPGAY